MLQYDWNGQYLCFPLQVEPGLIQPKELEGIFVEQLFLQLLLVVHLLDDLAGVRAGEPVDLAQGEWVVRAQDDPVLWRENLKM